jgi:hypothetical protein
VNEACPGSVETMRALTEALNEIRTGPIFSEFHDPEEIKLAKERFRALLDKI